MQAPAAGVAGIVEERNFAFDTWGDTVNVAARMAAEAEPGAVVAAWAVGRRLS